MKRSQEIHISKEERAIFSELKTMLTKQPGMLLTSKQLVRKTGMNRTKLSAGFYLLYGYRIKQYQLLQRMQLAKRELVTTNLPVKAIATHAGFINEKYFFIYFKQKTGLTPMQYRKHYFRSK